MDHSHRLKHALIGVVVTGGLAAGGLAACSEHSSSSTAPSKTKASKTVGGNKKPVIDPGDGGKYAPVINPADFVARIDNPYLPLKPGTRWAYESKTGGKTERTEIVVTSDRRQILGIPAVVVRDTVSVDGQVTEDTYDWYAQDRRGNVWYMGEATTQYENGKAVGTEGSFEAGVDGSRPGIVMPADPRVGYAYRQEYYPGKAEDVAKIVRRDATATVPGGRFDRLVVTRDWNPFKPKVVEEKYYAPGVGLVQEVHVAGGNERTELVSFTPGT